MTREEGAQVITREIEAVVKEVTKEAKTEAVAGKSLPLATHLDD